MIPRVSLVWLWGGLLIGWLVAALQGHPEGWGQVAFNWAMVLAWDVTFRRVLDRWRDR